MIHLVVALPSEAKPLVSRFRLKATETEPYRLFAGEEAALVVSGIGKMAAAAATAYLHSDAGRRPGAWLNIGLGGHRERPVGQGALAHKVVDAGSGIAWYPPLVFEPPGETAVVATVDRPELEYPEDAIYEMEAAGFLTAASRLATLELVQVYKVVSDSLEHPIGEHIDRSFVEGLIEARLEEIEAIGGSLSRLAAEIAVRDRLVAEPPGMDLLLAGRRASVTQRRRLVRLLTRYQALTGGRGEVAELLDDELAAVRATRDLLDRLEARLDEVAVRPTPPWPGVRVPGAGL